MIKETMTKSQHVFFVNAICTERNICCVGAGGTGKSYGIKAVINAIEKRLKKNVLVVGPTGIAARNIGGETIHRAFWAPTGVIPNGVGDIAEPVRISEVIIIDEISMVRMDLFEYVVNTIRQLEKESPNSPRKQLIVCGDFGQLPPVVGPGEKDEYKASYPSRYPFMSPLWKECDFLYITLNEVVRQQDRAFAEKLSRLRIADASVLREFRQNDKPSDTAVTICTRNKYADAINNEKLYRLPARHLYEAVCDCRDIVVDEMPVESRMVLAPGERVMFVNNDRDGQWANGSTAEILECNDDSVEIKMDDGREITLYPYEWPINRQEVDVRAVTENGITHYEKYIRKVKVGTYRQYPLRPAWAITIHRSQGQTFDEVNIAPGTFFDSGQLYVALSRCRTEEGMHICGQLRPSDLIVDPVLLEFMDYVNKNSDEDISWVEE